MWKWVHRKWSEAKSVPTSKGVAVLAFGGSLLLVGVNTGSTWLYLLASACFMLVAVSAFWSVLPLRDLRANRNGLVRATLGELVEYTVTLVVRGSHIPFVVWDEATGSFPAVIGGFTQSREVSGTLKAIPGKRGVYSSPPLVAACAAPFGLWRTKRTLPCSGDIEVAPAIADIQFPAGLVSHVLHGEGKREPPKRGKGYEFFALREYLPGDPVRHIYWPATARRDEVIVREFEEEGVTPLAVFPSTSPGVAASCCDRVLSVTGSLVRAAVKAHIPVRLAIPGGKKGSGGLEPLVLDSPSATVLRSALASAPAPVEEAQICAAARVLRQHPMAAVVAVKPASAPWPHGVEEIVDFVFVIDDAHPTSIEQGFVKAAKAWLVSREGPICFYDYWKASAA